MGKALDGVVVVEQAGRLAASICGALLAELGATVIRVESENGEQHFPALALPGKRRITSPPDTKEANELWRRLAERADAFILSSGKHLHSVRSIVNTPPPAAVVCTISAYGSDAPEVANAAADWVIKAECGIMAVTGEAGGPPQATSVPIFEVFAGINAATSIVAGLRVAKRDRAGQSIDISLFDAAFAMLGTHIAAAVSGSPRGHRVGCRHPLCAPWDVYRCGSEIIQICIASEAQWQRFTKLMMRDDLVTDNRFSNAGSRVANFQQLNRIIQDWLSLLEPSAVAQQLMGIGVSAAKVERIEDVLATFGARGDLINVDTGGRHHRRMRSILRMSRSPGVAPKTVEAASKDFESILANLPIKADNSQCDSAHLPLDGIQVVEIGPYTAGPLAGRYLSGIGAQVLKVEPPGGEDSRRFQPRFGGVSGFFSNYNWGKSAVSLDLEKQEDRGRLIAMLENADVVLQNLKPGALDRLGIHLRDISQNNRRLICCSISGYGADGPARPALDTVIQAQSGVMSRVGAGVVPIKSGFSLADLIAAHVAPLAVLAALHYRDRTGQGQQIDISMLDCLVWALQPVWDLQNKDGLRLRTIEASDGYVAVALTSDSNSTVDLVQNATPKLMRFDMVAQFRSAGLEAAAVLELDEVIKHPCTVTRRRLSMLPVAPGIVTPVISSPYRLGLTPPRHGLPINNWNEHSSDAGFDSGQTAIQGRRQ